MNEGSVFIPITGTHICADLYDCDAAILDNLSALREALLGAAQAANATVLEVSAHEFEPQGVTILLLLAESHMSIHTWPEEKYAAVDVFTCGTRMRPEQAIKVISAAVGAGRSNITTLKRGTQ